MIRLFTIGFTQTSAEHFFGRLAAAGVRKIVDVRLNNVSQLAGFAKRDDLAYFARAVGSIGYEHRLDLAPSPEMLESYRKRQSSWSTYAERFRALMAARKIEAIDRAALDGGCLLCSEASPHHCHRRLVGEYLQEKWGAVTIEHL